MHVALIGQWGMIYGIRETNFTAKRFNELSEVRDPQNKLRVWPNLSMTYNNESFFIFRNLWQKTYELFQDLWTISRPMNYFKIYELFQDLFTISRSKSVVLFLFCHYYFFSVSCFIKLMRDALSEYIFQSIENLFSHLHRPRLVQLKDNLK